MATNERSEDETPASNSNKKTLSAIEKAKSEAKVALSRAKAEERARLKTEKDLAEAREALAVAQTAVEQEHQERLKAEQSKDEAEQALAEVTNSIKVEAESVGLLPIVADKGEEQRVTFVVGVTVDEHDQPKRTEVVHALSRQSERFPGFDIKRMVAFMQAYFNPQEVTQELAIAPEPLLVEAKQSVLPRPVTRLAVSEVQVFRIGNLNVKALTLRPDEAFVVQAHFQVEGPEALSITAQEYPYEVMVYMNDMSYGRSTLLTNYRANLAKGILEYKAQSQVSGRPPGLYRLFTMINVQAAAAKLISYHIGPAVQVAA